MNATPRRRPRSSLAAVALLAWCTLAAAQERAPSTRFFFSGDGEIEMRHAHLEETLRLRYRDADGRYDLQALQQIEHFFRSRTDGRSGPISLRLVELIDFVQDRAHPTHMTLVSGYRSPEFNQKLRSGGGRVAESSLHTEGIAADVAFSGVELRPLWIDLRELGVGGVGLYQADGFLHLDTGRPRFWEPATSGVEKGLSKENARIFARTDFDRYVDLEGAVVRLHGVTALPIRVQRQASVGGRIVEIEPRGEMGRDGDCWLLRQAADRYEFVVASSMVPPVEAAPLRLRTCAPRLGATPREIATNPVQRLP
jgi:uncharacterized protein YcbK (DUF882 family)